MLKAAKEAGQIRDGRPVPDGSRFQLYDAGISKKSSRSQQLADIPAPFFEATLAQKKEDGRLSRSAFLIAAGAKTFLFGQRFHTGYENWLAVFLEGSGENIILNMIHYFCVLLSVDIGIRKRHSRRCYE
jgi:hypothetical protein